MSEGAQEKDYVLAWLLAARATLGPSSLVFKGGTALRRCYDLHQLLEDDPTLPDHAKDLFRRKAIAKSLNPDDLLARLDGRVKTWERLWQQSLENQVRDLPDFDGVWRRVIRCLRQADY